MKDVGKIQGSEAQAKELIVNKDMVYVHTNITKVEEENLYEYDEIQYDKDEYIKLISEKNKELEEQINNTQMALCEIYEGMEG